MKGCKYCANFFINDGDEHATKLFDVTTKGDISIRFISRIYDNGDLLTEMVVAESKYIELSRTMVHYCPMCGAKLER